MASTQTTAQAATSLGGATHFNVNATSFRPQGLTVKKVYFTEDDSKTSKTGSVTFNEADAPGGAKGVVDVLNGCKVGDREVKARASTLTIRRPVQPPPPPKITIVRPSAGSKGQQQQQQKSSAGNVATAAAAAASSASVSPGPKESNNVKRRRRALENGEKSYASEIRFLQQRYPDGLTVSKLDEPPVEVTLRVPLPPDCPFDIAGDALQCRIVFPAAYPAEACTVSVLNEDIPQRLRRKIDAAVQKRGATAYKENPAMASGLLRWMRNNVDTLLVDKLITDEYVTGIKLDVFDSTKTKSYVIEDDPSLFQHAMVKLPQTRGSGSIDGSEREQPQPQPQQKGPANEEKAEEEGGSGSGATEQDAESEGESGSDADGSAGAEPSRNGGGKPQTMYPTTTAHRGTQLVLPSLKMEGIGIMKCSQLEVIFLCGRCQYQGVASLVPDKVTQCECLKCHMEVVLKYRPEPVHENSSILGYIDKEGCNLFDSLPSSYVASCLECSAAVPLTKVPFSTLCELNCFSCHSKIRLFFDKIRFIRVREAKDDDDEILKRIQASRNKKKGTCKHYKQSHRWLRFPCCGRAWPCDKCHDENSDHPAQWATRMICGFCSKEQPYSATKPCVNCGGSATGTSKDHWEGGHGCRDKSKMSRKDSHKYKNTAAKTKSSKPKEKTSQK